jgi:ABC-type branched-subunit amino acid transport system substrate-binding protein
MAGAKGQTRLARFGRLRARPLVPLGICLLFFAATEVCAQTPALKVAVATSTSGFGVFYGAPSLEGAQLAVEEAGADTAAQRIELAVCDDHSTDDGARECARQIIGGDALVTVGPALSPSSISAGPIYAEGGVASIVTSATGGGGPKSPTTFRPIYSTGEMGASVANYLRFALGGNRATVLFRDNGFGQQFAAGFKSAAERLGMDVNYGPFATPAEAEEAARLAATDPDRPAIALGMLNDDALPVLKTLRRQGAQAPIIGTNAIAGDAFAGLFADQPEERGARGFFTDGVYAASPIMLDSASAETLAFVDRFRARFGHEPTWVAVQGYVSGRLAVAAARAAGVSGASDVKGKRAAALAYLASLDSPEHAVSALTGPMWFTPERGHSLEIRVGRFHAGSFASAPEQLVPVPAPERADIASGAVFDIGAGRFARLQQVVYTGLYLNEIPRIDIAQSAFTADFYLWLRFARSAAVGVADPTEIDFPDMVRGVFDAKKLAAKGDLDDGTTYRLWRVRGDFKNDFDLHHYPLDRQSLTVRLFNATAASDRLVYVQDRGGGGPGESILPVKLASTGDAAVPGLAAPTPSGAQTPNAIFGEVAPDAFRNLTQWEPTRVTERRDILVTRSALGDPRLVGVERLRELSGFNLTVELTRRTLATLAKNLLPLALMALIMYASLHFPIGLVKEKVTVAITGALSGAVLLSSINAQLGSVGYVLAVEYVFYIFFALCLLCIVAVLAAEQLRVAGRKGTATFAERSTRVLFLLTVAGTVAGAWLISARW